MHDELRIGNLIHPEFRSSGFAVLSNKAAMMQI